MSDRAGWDVVNPDALTPPKGWNHGMMAPAGARLLLVAGQVASGPDGRIIDGDMAAQWERSLENVLAVVREAGGGPASIGRMTVYVTDRAAYLAARPTLGDVWRRLMNRHYPAMAVVVVTGLVDDGAMVEIEATAAIPSDAAPTHP